MQNYSITKKTKSLGLLEVRPVDKKTAKEMVLANHYSKKWNDGGFGLYNFGIFKDQQLLGVAVYGYMKSPKAKIFSHPDPKGWMCELNRMWVSDSLGKNAESVLIGASLRLLKRMDDSIVAVQSFADGRLGCGTIYKAANFRYYGYHYSLFGRSKRTGEVIHEQIFNNTTSPTGYVRSNMMYIIGDIEFFKVKTYRYIFPFRKGFCFKLKEKPYPVYEKGEIEHTWRRNDTQIADNVCKLVYKLVGK